MLMIPNFVGSKEELSEKCYLSAKVKGDVVYCACSRSVHLFTRDKKCMGIFGSGGKYIMRKHIANIVTGSRIIFSILLLFFPVFSAWFYFTYLLCGLTDMVDGTIARKTNTVSIFGARLDSAADFIFVVAALIKLLPVMNIPCWLWIWILVIAGIKIINFVSGYVCNKRFLVEHTIMNKITGFLLFVFPLTLSLIGLEYSAGVVCTIATFSAVQEGYYIRTGREIK